MRADKSPRESIIVDKSAGESVTVDKSACESMDSIRARVSRSDRGATLRLGGMTEYWGGHNTFFLTNSLLF